MVLDAAVAVGGTVSISPWRGELRVGLPRDEMTAVLEQHQAVHSHEGLLLASRRPACSAVALVTAVSLPAETFLGPLVVTS